MIVIIFILLYGPFNSGGKSFHPKKKIYGAKITVSICLQDNRRKGGLGGCWQLEDIDIYMLTGRNSVN